MDRKENIRHVICQAIADAFMMDAASIEADTGKRLREDLGASSMQYFPIISTVEDEFNLEIDLHEFQNEARTVEDAVDYVCRVYEKQYEDE